MNTADKLVTALTPGSIFNRNGLIFRSLSSLASFAELEEGEVLELLNGDMAQIVTCKPSKKGKGILVALTAQIPVPEEDAPVCVAAVPLGPPGMNHAALADLADDPGDHQEVAVDIPLEDAPIEEAEEVVA